MGHVLFLAVASLGLGLNCLAGSSMVPADCRDCVSNASVSDALGSSLFDTVAAGQGNTLLSGDYSALYFSNLRENFGNNVLGTCTYVSIGMLLSFYDTYWNDSFIPEAYDQASEFASAPLSSQDYEFPLFGAASPGVRFEGGNLVNGLSMSDYLQVANQNSETYFQFKLIQLSQTYFGSGKFDASANPFGMSYNEMIGFLNYYLYNYLPMSTSDVTIDSVNGSAAAIKSFAIQKITSGMPVLLRAKTPGNTSAMGHAMIAYDYNSSSGEIYVHTGWRKESEGIALTHVSLSELGFTDLWDATAIEPQRAHSHSNNYHSSRGSSLCACNYSFPQDIELISGNYRDERPTFRWDSLFDEKWFSAYNPYFDFSILNANNNQVFEAVGINECEYTLTDEQWGNVLYETSGNIYYAYLRLDSATYTYWDEYYSKEEFTKPLEYAELPAIKPNEYGFDDAYPTDSATKTSFVNHTASHGFAFKTRRYRTGYIHDEYVVMSPIRSGITEAFIEYRFNTAVTRIDVELAHWRSTSQEWLTSSTGTAVFQYYWGDSWTDKLDLLASSTVLPTNRNLHKFYRIIFDNPVYRVRFYSSTFSANTNDSNRGRICIGDMAFYPSTFNLPLSGSECDYTPDAWNGYDVGDYNCYAYALNTKSYGYMQPGQSIGHTRLSDSEICDPNTVLNYVVQDSDNYSFTFQSVGKHERCLDGCYKVALVIDNEYASGEIYKYDYHWYRQNSDGTWSQKHGGKNVQNVDESDFTVFDPESCNRNCGFGLNYNLFVGFYAVTPLN